MLTNLPTSTLKSPTTSTTKKLFQVSMTPQGLQLFYVKKGALLLLVHTLYMTCKAWITCHACTRVKTDQSNYANSGVSEIYKSTIFLL